MLREETTIYGQRSEMGIGRFVLWPYLRRGENLGSAVRTFVICTPMMSSIPPAHPEPSTESIGRDARRLSADHHKVAPGEIAIGVIIGRASEDFDFFVFGIAAVLVFPAVFFPFEEGLEGTLWSFAICSLAFVARCW